MRHVIGSVVIGIVLATLAASADGTNVMQRLRTENGQLREENRKLREEIVQGREIRNETISNPAPSNATADVQYWITSGSKKRHNPTCKYYKQSKGYLTKDKIGVPCKICGG